MARWGYISADLAGELAKIFNGEKCKMVEKDKTKTKKKSLRPGRRIGTKSNPAISVKINDPDRSISIQWEAIKQINSLCYKETAAETAKRIFLAGMKMEQKRIAQVFSSNIQNGQQQSENLFD